MKLYRFRSDDTDTCYVVAKYPLDALKAACDYGVVPEEMYLLAGDHDGHRAKLLIVAAQAEVPPDALEKAKEARR